MTDDQFIAAFEACSLGSQPFHHRDHVRLAWLYLHRYPPLEALHRFTEGLKRFAASKGHPGLYHETITWAYLFLIRERIAANECADWNAFAGSNADLMSWKPSILDRYYTEDTLASDRARRLFVLPDLGVYESFR
jgi:hypothetical protein